MIATEFFKRPPAFAPTPPALRKLYERGHGLHEELWNQVLKPILGHLPDYQGRHVRPDEVLTVQNLEMLSDDADDLCRAAILHGSPTELRNPDLLDKDLDGYSMAACFQLIREDTATCDRAYFIILDNKTSVMCIEGNRRFHQVDTHLRSWSGKITASTSLYVGGTFMQDVNYDSLLGEIMRRGEAPAYRKTSRGGVLRWYRQDSADAAPSTPPRATSLAGAWRGPAR